MVALDLFNNCYDPLELDHSLEMIAIKKKQPMLCGDDDDDGPFPFQATLFALTVFNSTCFLFHCWAYIRT